ncbi:hypothetical protein Tco_0813911 [Tanacetum coccineum]
MLKKGNYILWESRFRRFLDNKLEDGERMWRSIKKGPCERPLITNPDDSQVKIIEPLSKMTESNKKKYIADVKVMHNLLQAIPNDIYNSVDTSKDGESLEFMYERLTTIVNIMDHNNDGRVDIQTKNVGFGGNDNMNAGRQNKNQAFNVGSGSTQNNDSHYARDCSKPRVCDAKYFREQMLLAMKDEAESNLNDEENDFMLDNSFLDETLEELTVALAKKAFKEREDRYLEDIVDLEEKLNSEETLEDAKESRLKMRHEIVQLDYNKLNDLYETFVPQQETSIDQTYFSIPSTSNITSKSKEV